MRHYEVVVVLSPILNQDESADAWDRIKGFISNRSGEITHEEKWGTRRLAYPIRKGQHQFLEGTYHLTRFSTGQPFNKELEVFLRLEEQVLRSLGIVKLTDVGYPLHSGDPNILWFGLTGFRRPNRQRSSDTGLGQRPQPVAPAGRRACRGCVSCAG